jgi:hypothetical protein
MSPPYKEIFVISLVAVLTSASREPENEKIDEGECGSIEQSGWSLLRLFHCAVYLSN